MPEQKPLEIITETKTSYTLNNDKNTWIKTTKDGATEQLSEAYPISKRILENVWDSVKNFRAYFPNEVLMESIRNLEPNERLNGTSAVMVYLNSKGKFRKSSRIIQGLLGSQLEHQIESTPATQHEELTENEEVDKLLSWAEQEQATNPPTRQENKPINLENI